MTSARADRTVHSPAAVAVPVRGYLFLFVAVLFWGGSASLAKYLLTTRFDTLIITQTRSSLSFLIFAAYFLVRDRSVFRVDRQDIMKLLLLGVIGVSLTNYAYYFTVRESTVATAILIQYTAPVLVMMYAVAVSKEEMLTGAKLLALVFSLAGCFLAVSGGSFSEIRLSGWALVSGIGSALCYSYMLLGSKHLLRKYSVWTMLTYAFGFSALFWLLVNPPWAIVERGYGVEDWGIFWVFAVLSILIPHSFFSMSLKLLEASRVGIASTMEPVVAIVVAYLALGESITGMQMVGGVAVVLAVLMLQLRRDHVPSSFAEIRRGQ
jgi:drug/metabolite transporter (DMT)-like permease